MMPTPDLAISYCGVSLQNPIIAASGVFGYGEEFAAFYDSNILGAFSCKGTTLEPRFGNESPRTAECTAGMLNAVGLQNPGVAAVLGIELPRLRKHYRQPLIANIGGFSLEEYAQCCDRLSASPSVDLVELNISCPNVHGGGLAFGTDPACAAQVTAACKAVCRKPLIVKLSPNVTDIAAVALACEAAGADGLSLINTLLGMRLDLRTRKPVLSTGAGGFSGPAVFPVALRMVYQVYAAVRIPILGMGGVASARDVIEMMLAGAAAVQVGAANLTDPFACPKILADLPAEMERLGIDSLREIVGAAHGK
ncbi:MAG: dihydroorotate dehydrogenase [Oscillospiraceae bacterium]|jgi:dihydroorotate dehydrogenase (NAD+) catalytic subunit|nr:dihydroorotate dehydrogenase [Oscillospiraceae bacterium]